MNVKNVYCLHLTSNEAGMPSGRVCCLLGCIRHGFRFPFSFSARRSPKNGIFHKKIIFCNTSFYRNRPPRIPHMTGNTKHRKGPPERPQRTWHDHTRPQRTSGPLHSVFRSDPASLTCSAHDTQQTLQMQKIKICKAIEML